MINPYKTTKNTLKEMWKMFSYKSSPGLPLYYERIMRALIHPVSKLFANSVMAHTWDWVNEPVPNSRNFIQVPPDPEAITMNSLWDAFMVDTGGWKKTYLISLKEEAMDSPEAEEGWTFAYHQTAEEVKKMGNLAYKLATNKIRKLRVVFDPHEKIRVLAGPYPFKIFAKGVKNGAFLPLEVVDGPFDRSDRKYSEYSLI